MEYKLFFREDIGIFDTIVLGFLYILTGIVMICTFGLVGTYLGVNYLSWRDKKWQKK